MTRRTIAFCLTLLASSSLWAQPPAQVEPLTDAVVVATGETHDHYLLSSEAAVLGEREFLVTWDLNFQNYSGSQLINWGSAISGRKVSLQGQPVGEELVLEPLEQRSFQGLHRMAADGEGRFSVFWEERDESELQLRRFRPDGTVLETTALGPRSIGILDLRERQAIAMDPSGRFSAAWTESAGTFPPNLWMQIFDASAEPVRKTEITGKHSPVLAMTNGITILVYQDEATTRVQRFNVEGRRLGPATAVVGGSSRLVQPAVAANGEGRFVVVASSAQGIVARIFDLSGNRVSPVIRVSTATVYGDSSPDVALDARGNFAVVWHRATGLNTPGELRARLYNRDGVPQGGELTVDPEVFSQFLSASMPSVAMTRTGTFLVAWTEDITAESVLPVVETRLYAPLRDDDRCVFRDGAFLCDTARDGNLEHLKLDFGDSNDRPLLADFDGDGLDNPCVRRGSVFLCDTAGGGSADFVLRFGAASQTPLAGDLNGDGVDEPCVRRGRTLLCDTAYDGGRAEFRLALGTRADQPALGDVDGDGDDDPCVLRDSTGTFLCDTSHDGTPDLSHAVDSQSGDRPLLGDLDGDGDADFCVARGETLLCDLDRDGHLEEEVLATEAGDVVVLGNVDGV